MRQMAATLALAFAAAPLLAQDRAVPRGGGSSGGGSSSSGSSHHSSSSSGSSSSGGSSSSSSGSSGSSGTSYSSGTAERRHPRAGTGTGNRYGYGYGYGGGGYYPGYYPWYPWYYPSSYAYGPYWGAYYYGYWPYGAYYSGGGYSSSYSRSSSDESGAIRVLVDPEDAKVYVDGYYAGKVDDFDGFTQRLHVARGPHEILLKRDGYRSQRYRVYASAGDTIKIEHDMQKGQGEGKLQDLTGGRDDSAEGRYAPDPRGAARDDGAIDEDAGADAPPPSGSGRDDAGADPAPGATRGTLALRVWPADASVYLDGEFRGTGRQLRTLELSPGPHRIEVVRPGFPTYQREVEIRAGRNEDLLVTLEQP